MAPGRILYGWWVALALSLMVLLSTGIRFTVGPFLKPVVADLGLDRGSFSLVVSLSLFLFDVTGGYGAAFLVGCSLLLVGGALSVSIDARPRWVPALAPLAGGR